MKVNLLIIDPQNDFCDPRGALSIKGANADMKRLADMIRGNRDKISAIDVTLDSHRWLHIAHPIFWEDEQGRRPKPFTKITLEDVKEKRWQTRLAGYEEYVLKYLRTLEEEGRYDLTIWAPHCLIGSWGHNTFPPLLDAILYFEEHFKRVNYHFKGTNTLTEHYSAIKPAFDETGTQINQWLVDRVKESDKLLVGGEAMSHCVANTVRDILEVGGVEMASKIVLLRDTMSNVMTCDGMGEDFLKEMEEQGVEISSSEAYFV